MKEGDIAVELLLTIGSMLGTLVLVGAGCILAWTIACATCAGTSAYDRVQEKYAYV